VMEELETFVIHLSWMGTNPNQDLLHSPATPVSALSTYLAWREDHKSDAPSPDATSLLLASSLARGSIAGLVQVAWLLLVPGAEPTRDSAAPFLNWLSRVEGSNFLVVSKAFDGHMHSDLERTGYITPATTFEAMLPRDDKAKAWPSEGSGVELRPEPRAAAEGLEETEAWYPGVVLRVKAENLFDVRADLGDGNGLQEFSDIPLAQLRSPPPSPKVLCGAGSDGHHLMMWLADCEKL